MAEETEIRKILRIEGIETVKQLRDYVKSLQDELVKADVGSKQYEETTHKLVLVQEKLGEVTKKNKQEQEAATDSIVGMEREYKNLYNTYKLLSEEERKSEFGVETGKRLAELSEKLNTTKKEVGNFKDNIGHYSTAFDDFDKVIGGLKGSSEEMVQGFNALNNTLGISATMGSGLSDSFSKIQSIMLILNGLKGLKGTTSGLKAMVVQQKASAAASTADAAAKTGEATATGAATVAQEGLNTAMKLNPIGLILTAVASLIVYFQDIVEWVQKILGLDVNKELEEIANTNENLNKTFEEQNKKMDLQVRIMEAQGKSQKEIITTKKNLVDAQLKETKATIDNMNARIAQMKADSAWVRFWKGENKQIKALEEELKELTGTYDTLKEQSEGFANDLIVGEEKNKHNMSAITKKNQEDIKKRIEAMDSMIEKLEETDKKYIDIVKARYLKEQKDLDLQQKEDLKKVGENQEERNNILARYAALRTAMAKQEIRDEAAARVKDFNDALNDEYAKIEREGNKDGYHRVLGLLGLADTTAGDNTQARSLIEKKIKSLIEVVNKEMGTNYQQYNFKEFNRLIDENAEAFEKLPEPLKSATLEYRNLYSAMKDVYDSNQSNQIDKLLDKINNATELSDKLSNIDILGSMVQGFLGNEKDSGRMSTDEYEIAKKKVKDYILKFKDEVSKEAYEAILNDPKASHKEHMNAWQMLFGTDSLFDANGNIKNDAALAKFIELQDTIFGRTREWWQRLGESAEDTLTRVSNFMEMYGNSTTTILDNIAKSWENIINKKVEDGDMTEEQAKRQFESIKALQYSSTWINTLAAMVSALAEPELPWVAKAINAAAALSTGIASTIQIANTSFGSSGAGLGVSVSPAIITEEPMNVRNTNTGEYIDYLNENPIHCYITDRDVEESVKRREEREKNTSF